MEDYTSKIETLIRLGLMPVSDIPWLKKAFGHVRQNMFLPVQERKVFYKFVDDFLKITLDNPALLRLIMNKTGQLRREDVQESKKKYKKAFPKGDKHTDTSASSIGDVQNRPPTASEDTEMADVKKLIEHVRERDGKFVVTNKSGNKTLGTHGTRKAAVKQLQAIEISKHAHGESIDYKKGVHKDYANIKGMDGSCAENHAGGTCAKCGFNIESSAIQEKYFGYMELNFDKKKPLMKLVPKKTPKDSDENTHRTKPNVKESLERIANAKSHEKVIPPVPKRLQGQLDALIARQADEKKKKGVKESLDITEEINFRKVSTNTLVALANAPQKKKKAGGHITAHDKQLASLAKRELQRRKHMGESVDYTERFTKALEHFGVQDISDLDVETTKDFLAFVDTQNEAVISANSQKHLPVSDDIKAKVAQDMAKRKDLKARLMASAGDEYAKHLAATREPSAARKLFKKDLKTESVLDTSPNVVLVKAKVRTTKENKRTQGHAGKKE